MPSDSSRRDFLRTGGVAASGLVVGAAAAADSAPVPQVMNYPRDHPAEWANFPVGTPLDRGKLVPGRRNPGDPPVLVETPDLPNNLPHKLVNGVKEFHLHAQPVRRELLPDFVANHWGYNGTMPGPTIQVTEGDRIRIVLHNELPEPTTLHLHGFELPNRMDGVPHVIQTPVPPGGTCAYEMTLRQNGTYFYHSHFAMQEAIGMMGLVIIHPRKAWEPVVDQDFALIAQEFAIKPASHTPGTTSMDFTYFTFNGRAGPYTTPLVVRLGNRVRIRIVNFSTDDHHPIHLHGHTFWVTGTEGGRVPESAWIPGNNVLVGVAQAREFEFIANNPGDWVMHCHMFHHTMNHMVTGVGPGSETKAVGGKEDPRYQVPGYPQSTGMMAMPSPAAVRKLTSQPQTRGMREHWYMGVGGLMTVVRVLPPELYDQVVSGKGDIPPGASVPGSAPSHMDRMPIPNEPGPPGSARPAS